MKKIYSYLTVVAFITAHLVPLPLLADSENVETQASEEVIFTGDLVMQYALQSLSRIENAQYRVVSLVEGYEVEATSTPLFVSHAYSAGSARMLEEEYSQEGMASGTAQVITPVAAYVTNADTISFNDVSYVRFNGSSNELIDGQWIEVPAAQYEAFAETLGQEQLLDIMDDRGLDADEVEELERDFWLIEQSGLYDVRSSVHETDHNEREVLVFTFGFNRDRIAEYYTRVQEELSEEELAETYFAIEGFAEAIEDEDFLDQLVEHSWISIAFDKETLLPTYMGNLLFIPAFGEQTYDLVTLQELELSNINTHEFEMVVPGSFITMTEALEIFGIDPEVVTE